MTVLDRSLLWLKQYRTFLVPVAMLAMVMVLVVPLPPGVMDAIIALNFALAALVLVRAASLRKPLEFSVFPALLLGTTLLRLVANVASTRLILGAEAANPVGMEGVAGELIQAFGKLMAGNNTVVGAAVFAIVVVVQFVVITKGAGRMSEVAARFALDALPGRQMAIDADLAAGAIKEPEARRRREDLMREADFFGAMDGASRFVRGDAVAGMLITGVNIVGGLAVGVLQKGWSVQDTLKSVTILTIGDGLAAQIPAFVVAVAAGLVVARAGRGRTLGEELPAQLAGSPATLAVLAAFLAVLAFTSLPTVPLLSAAAVVGLGAWLLKAGRAQSAALASGGGAAAAGARTAHPQRPAGALPEPKPLEPGHALADGTRDAAAARVAEIGAMLAVEPLEVELGSGLVALARGGEQSALLRRIEGIRRQVAQELGIVVPPVRVRDERQLGSSSYRIRIRGATVGEGELRLDDLLAMSSDGKKPTLPGISAREPAFGLEAVWIAPSLRSLAESRGCAVAAPDSVLGAHLATVVRRHADELLTREHVADLLAQLRQRAPRLVDETVPGIVKPGELQRVLQLLLRERVPVRDLEAILEAVADAAPRVQDAALLAEAARGALRRSICQLYLRPDGEGRATLTCIAAGDRMDQQVAAATETRGGDTVVTLTADQAAAVVQAVAQAAQPLAEAGLPVVVLASRVARPGLARLLAPHIPGGGVLAYEELVRGVQIERIGQAELSDAVAEATA